MTPTAEEQAELLRRYRECWPLSVDTAHDVAELSITIDMLREMGCRVEVPVTRDITPPEPERGHAGARNAPEPERPTVDNATLAARLRAMADLIEDATFAVSWLYVDPTPDGPDEARTVHTVELDGQSAAEVLGNLGRLVSGFHTLEHISAECSPGRVVFEAVGSVVRGTDQQIVRGTAIVLDPYATPLRVALGLPAERYGDTAIRYDLNPAQVDALAADPSLQPGVEAPGAPQVDIPAPTGGTTPMEEQPSTPTETPSGTTPAPDSSTSSGTPSEPSAPSTPQPEPVPEPQPVPSTPQPADSGGVVVRGNSDTVTPSPDPTATATTGPADVTPPASGQQPGTSDGAAWNTDGTPVEPTAGASADPAGPADSSATPSGGTPDPTLPGQTPIAVDERTTGADESVGSGPPAGFEEVSPEQKQSRIAALQAELAALQAPGQGGGEVAVTGDTGVTVAGNADAVPEGGANLASGQGGGASGDPAGGGYTSGGASSDGY